MNTIGHNNPKRAFKPSSVYSRRREDSNAGGITDSCADTETFPWRIVGYGDHTWAVEGCNGRTVHRGEDISRAHAVARAYKVLHPAGTIDKLSDKGESNNISGPNHTIPTRLSGHLIEITNIETGNKVRYLATHAQPSLHHVRVLDLNTNHTRDLKVTSLANNPTLKVDLNIDQFLTTPIEAAAEIEATA